MKFLKFLVFLGWPFGKRSIRASAFSERFFLEKLTSWKTALLGNSLSWNAVFLESGIFGKRAFGKWSWEAGYQNPVFEQR